MFTDKAGSAVNFFNVVVACSDDKSISTHSATPHAYHEDEAIERDTEKRNRKVVMRGI